MVLSLRRKVRSTVMVYSSCKMAWRRWCVLGRSRSCLVIIFLVSFSLWMLTATQSDERKVGVKDKNTLQLMSKDSISSISRTKEPVGPKEADKPKGRAGKRLHGAEEAEPLPLDIENEPIYKTLPREAKETGDAILVFLEYADTGRSLLNVLLLHRFDVKVALVHDSTWPAFTKGDRGLYSLIIFESLRSYTRLGIIKTRVLEEYCRVFNAGIIIFTLPESPNDIAQVRNHPLFINPRVRLKDPIVHQTSGIPRMMKANQRFYGNLQGDNWTTFRTNSSSYVPIMEAVANVPVKPAQMRTDLNFSLNARTCVLYDRGSLDGIKRIYFGYSVDHFLHVVLLLDSVSFLTNGRLQTALDRYILIDIDDIFVARTGIRMKASDVESLVSAQEEIQELVTGFRFNLGFSGKYYEHGDEEENAGDRKIIEVAKNFWWFPHMWDHMQPHMITPKSKLRELMKLNKKFAVDHNIPVTEGYSVAPHHSGVYPVHDDLYDLWKEIWNVRSTSTEEYPHLRPAHKRRGFVHQDIMVVPRQTCSLYTKTNFFSDFQGGKVGLDALVQGGELFRTIISNPVNIFMTHMSNYGNDRLAPYAFKHAFQFARTYTNLRMQTLPPLDTAKKYFELYPQEREPLWGNPCEDRRLMEVWAEGKDCTRLPHSLILGPQKTGTTALYTFLQMHKRIKSNRQSETTFEEVQFFNGQNYYNGLDWYLDFFPSTQNGSRAHIFEKSATYFDSVMAPKRVKALLPKAKLIIILLDPAKRAYSWYHHMRSHLDDTSLQYSFLEVITADSASPKPLQGLQKRCLEPGKYAMHIERWLQYFSYKQILLLDGEQLRNNPPMVMQKVQKFLRVKPVLDYSRLLKYDTRKGFFCPMGAGNRTHCLGKGKGRKYPEMTSESEEYLNEYFQQDNLRLSTLLEKLHLESPKWLRDYLLLKEK